MTENNLDDLIKALRCLASNDTEGGCYEDHYNFGNDGRRQEMSCYGLYATIMCPYHQNTYGVCFEDGECQEWLGEAAGLIAELQRYRQIGTVEECREARKKQEPMEVTDIHVDEYYCPACGTENCCDQGIVGDKYCPFCGQALKQRGVK